MVGSVIGAVAGPVIGSVLGGGKSSNGTGQSSNQTMSNVVTVPSYLQPDVNNLAALIQNYSSQGYQPYTGNAVAGFNPYQLQAQQGTANQLGQYAPNMQAASNAAGQATNLASQGFVNPQTIAQYMNPYQQGVTDISLQQSLRQYDQLQNQTNDQAAFSGAFGGSRQAVANSENQRNEMQQLNNIQTQGLDTNYNQAVSTALNAGQAQTTSLNQSGQNLANLGIAGQNYNLTGLNAENTVGQQVQAQDQAPLTFAYNQYLNQQQFTPQQLSSLISSMAPLLGQNSSGNSSLQNTNPGLTTGQQILGGGAVGSALNSSGTLGTYLDSMFGGNSTANSYSNSMPNTFSDTGTYSGDGDFNEMVNFRKGGLVKYAQGGSVKGYADGGVFSGATNPSDNPFAQAINVTPQSVGSNFQQGAPTNMWQTLLGNLQKAGPGGIPTYTPPQVQSQASATLQGYPQNWMSQFSNPIWNPMAQSQGQSQQGQFAPPALSSLQAQPAQTALPPGATTNTPPPGTTPVGATPAASSTSSGLSYSDFMNLMNANPNDLGLFGGQTKSPYGGKPMGLSVAAQQANAGIQPAGQFGQDYQTYLANVGKYGFAKGGVIKGYAQGGAIRGYDDGGLVDDLSSSSSPGGILASMFSSSNSPGGVLANLLKYSAPSVGKDVESGDVPNWLGALQRLKAGTLQTATPPVSPATANPYGFLGLSSSPGGILGQDLNSLTSPVGASPGATKEQQQQLYDAQMHEKQSAKALVDGINNQKNGSEGLLTDLPEAAKGDPVNVADQVSQEQPVDSTTQEVASPNGADFDKWDPTKYNGLDLPKLAMAAAIMTPGVGVGGGLSKGIEAYTQTAGTLNSMKYKMMQQGIENSINQGKLGVEQQKAAMAQQMLAPRQADVAAQTQQRLNATAADSPQAKAQRAVIQGFAQTPGGMMAIQKLQSQGGKPDPKDPLQISLANALQTANGPQSQQQQLVDPAAATQMAPDVTGKGNWLNSFLFGQGNTWDSYGSNPSAGSQ